MQVGLKKPSAAFVVALFEENVGKDASKVIGTQKTSLFGVFSLTQPGV
jgi:hypothetical protein